MFQISRMFSTTKAKGTRNYINSQKKYEIIRTLIYFGMSISLFIAGYVATKTKTNLLTVVAVLGCLPASKSAVSAIMFLRFKSCQSKNADQIEAHIGCLQGVYDMIFTSYQTNYPVSHLVVQGSIICGFTEQEKFSEKDFQNHVEGILKLENYKNYTIKVFKDINKYTERLDQLNELEAENVNAPAILETLKSVTL